MRQLALLGKYGWEATQGITYCKSDKPPFETYILPILMIRRITRGHNGELIGAIRKTIALQEGTFTTKQVREYLELQYPELMKTANITTVATTLRRIRKLGELTLVESGGPGKSAVYKKAK